MHKKVLQALQSGNLEPLLSLKAVDPHFHWISIRYEKTGDTALHFAAQSGQIDVINHLISSIYTPTAINCTNNDNKTALHEAAQFTQLETAKILIQNGGDVNALKRADWTPLMLACTKSEPKIVDLLLKHSALVNLVNKDGWNCLHLASRVGCAQIFDLLVENGGDVTKQTKNGRNCLHIAALHGNIIIIERIIAKNAILIDSRDNCGNTALHEAILGDNREIAEFLVENGANFTLVNSSDLNLLHLAASEGHNNIITNFLLTKLEFKINTRNRQGWTALHCAARKKQMLTVNLLVEIGCDPSICDNYNRTALDYIH